MTLPKVIDPHVYSPDKSLPLERCRVCDLDKRTCELTYKPRNQGLLTIPEGCLPPRYVQPNLDLLALLGQHEIKCLSVCPQPYSEKSKCNGFDITIAECTCGHSSPLGNRSVHLAYVLERAYANA